jgi:hypothetical protein
MVVLAFAGREKVVCEAVTPGGSPLTLTVTTPVKLLKPFAETWMVLLVERSRVDEEGVSERVKDGGPNTAMLILAVCVMEPLTACKVMVAALSAGALVAAVKVTAWLPVVDNENIAGLAVTPEGNPLIEIEMVPANPFKLLAATLTVCDEPSASVTLGVLAVREKSGVCAPPEEEEVWLPEPQPVMAKTSANRRILERAAKTLRMLDANELISNRRFAIISFPELSAG